MQKKQTAIVLGVLVVLIGGVYILKQRNELQVARDESHQCVSNLKQLSLVAESYFTTHGAAEAPDDLKAVVISVQGSPKLLFCPTDPKYTEAANMNWSGFDESLEPSYVGHFENGYDQTTPGEVVLECPIHGHQALMDGSVQKPLKSKSLLQAMF